MATGSDGTLDVRRPWWLLPEGRLHPAWWILPAVALAWWELSRGPSAQYPVIYVIPACLAAWYSGRRPAVALALVFPVIRIAHYVATHPAPAMMSAYMGSTLLRGAGVMLFALWFARLAELERDLTRRVQVLEGLLPICSFCKSIRNGAGEWEQFERYISNRSTAEFSHSVCPTCGEEHYPEEMGKA